jgi:hypothetical protein
VLKAVKPPNSNTEMITRCMTLLLGLCDETAFWAPRLIPGLFKIAHFKRLFIPHFKRLFYEQSQVSAPRVRGSALVGHWQAEKTMMPALAGEL